MGSRCTGLKLSGVTHLSDGLSHGAVLVPAGLALGHAVLLRFPCVLHLRAAARKCDTLPEPGTSNSWQGAIFSGAWQCQEGWWCEHTQSYKIVHITQEQVQKYGTFRTSTTFSNTWATQDTFLTGLLSFILQGRWWYAHHYADCVETLFAVMSCVGLVWYPQRG